MKLLRALFFFLCLVVSSLPSAAMPVGWELRGLNDADVDVQLDPKTGSYVATAPHGVIGIHQGTVLTANKLSLNESTGEVLAEGAVTIKAPDTAWSGERFVYNYKTEQLSGATFKSSRTGFYVSGEGLTGNQTNKTYTGTRIRVTTDDYADPAYEIRARKFTLVPGEYYEAESATIYLGDVPVGFFPRYRRSLKGHSNYWVLTPGYRSLYGPYLLSSYHWGGNTNWDAGMHFDLRQRRGLAGGPEFNYDTPKFGKGRFEYYYAKDDHPGIDFAGNAIRDDRQRVRFTHTTQFDTNFTFKTAVRYQNDPLIVRDFFESEYRGNVQPNSFAELNKAWRNWSLDVLVQPQLNDFFETVERLPDVKLTGLRQQIFDTPLFYDSESSAGYFRREFASTNLVQPDFEAFRGDTYHQMTLPRTYFGWLNFTPRVGGRFTYYTEGHGPGATTSEQARGVFNTGAELTFKASRIWGDAESKLFDVKGIRHIVEPGINYVYVPDPNVRPPKLPQFDYELPSLRLLPLDYPDYNAIDSVDSENVLRLSLRNKLQTKRGNGIDNLVNWALYTDWRLDPRTNQTTFADFFSDLDLRPRSWLLLNSETRFGLEGLKVREANHRMVLAPSSTWSLTLGHRYIDNDPAFGPVSVGHNLIYDSFYYKFNENWAYRMSHFFETRDGVMEEQYYTLYRDLRSWTAALTLRLRDSRFGSDDFTIAITFSLKAFPRFKMGSDGDSPSTLVGS